MANIGSMDGIQNLLRETIAEFMENGLEEELDEGPGYKQIRLQEQIYRQQPQRPQQQDAAHRLWRKGCIRSPGRKGEFDPRVLKKNQTSISQGIEEKILSMYANAMTAGDIEAHIREIYGVSVSGSTVSRIADKTCPSPESGSSGLWNPSTPWYF